MASGSKKVIYAALIGNALISVTKFIAASITGSSAMLSEGIHSVVDTGNQILLLMGMNKAKRPADKDFPFGHGKEIYFWSFIVAILIFALGAGISIYEGIHHILEPEPMTSPTINYIVLACAILFEGAALFVAVKEFNKSRGKLSAFQAVKHGKDPSLFVVLFEDSAAIAGLFIALIGIFLSQITGMALWDGIASIIIGLILGMTAIWLAHETKGLLIGESAEPKITQSIQTIMNNHPSVKHAHEILTLHMGPDFILVTISADFMPDIPSQQLQDDIGNLAKEIKGTNPLVKRVFIEAETATTAPKK